MEDIVDTNPVPAVEEPEITSAATTGPGPAEPTASDGSGGGDGNEASCPWSLSEDEQVRNLKENWRRAFNWQGAKGDFANNFEESPWFASVVEKLRADPCLESSECEVDQSVIGRHLSGAKMTSLDMAILVGDLKMVQKICFERRSVSDNRGLLVDPERASRSILFISRAPQETFFPYTPLHLAVLGGNSHIVDVLLEKGADVNARNWLSETPLDLACEMGNVTMLLKLLKKDEKDEKDAFLVAVGNGNVNFLKKLRAQIKPLDCKNRPLLHYLASHLFHNSNSLKNTLKYLVEDGTLDMKAKDDHKLSAFYVAVLRCNTQFVIALLDSFKDQIRVNEACNKVFGPPVQIAIEGGDKFREMKRILLQCDVVKDYMERAFRDRQIYVDATNAILVGAALIASVTFASWLQPPLNYTSYFGEGYSNSDPAPSTSNLNYVDVEHNIALRAFWVFNALSFYFAVGTVVCGARSVLPRNHIFIRKTVEKLRTNLWVISVLLVFSVLSVVIAFAIAGTIVLTPLVKYQWCMIVPTIVGGMLCIISLVLWIKNIIELTSIRIRKDNEESGQKEMDYLKHCGYT